LSQALKAYLVGLLLPPVVCFWCITGRACERSGRSSQGWK